MYIFKKMYTHLTLLDEVAFVYCYSQDWGWGERGAEGERWGKEIGNQPARKRGGKVMAVILGRHR
jgi:hypothetical protein